MGDQWKLNIMKRKQAESAFIEKIDLVSYKFHIITHKSFFCGGVVYAILMSLRPREMSAGWSKTYFHSEMRRSINSTFICVIIQFTPGQQTGLIFTHQETQMASIEYC